MTLFTEPVANVVFPVVGRHRFLSVPPGKHTVTLYFASTSGLLTMRTTNRTIDVEEVW
jgi:hypothetical protein